VSARIRTRVSDAFKYKLIRVDLVLCCRAVAVTAVEIGVKGRVDYLIDPCSTEHGRAGSPPSPLDVSAVTTMGTHGTTIGGGKMPGGWEGRNTQSIHMACQ